MKDFVKLTFDGQTLEITNNWVQYPKDRFASPASLSVLHNNSTVVVVVY
jgi:hypothetical protein